MKDIAKKSTGFYLLAGAVLFCVIGLIAYWIAGNDVFGLQPMVLVFLALAAVAGVIFCVKDFYGLGPIVVTILISIAFGYLFNARFMYFSHIFYGISSEALSASMLITVISFAAALVLSITSAFLKKES